MPPFSHPKSSVFVAVSAKPDANVLWHRNDELMEQNERITTRKEPLGTFILHFKRLEMQDQVSSLIFKTLQELDIILMNFRPNGNAWLLTTTVKASRLVS